MNQQQVRETIASYLQAGLCALPAISKMKRPVGNWKQYQDRFPTIEEVDAIIKQQPMVDAIAIICGSISGNLEVIDFDWQGKSLEDWGEQMEALGVSYVQFPIEQTQSSGYHLFYRSLSAVAKNTKLTWKNFDESELQEVNGSKYYHGKEVLKGKDGKYGGCTIETRGEGGLVIVAPSTGYKMIKGSWLNVPVVDDQTIKAIKASAFALSDANLEPPKRVSNYSCPIFATPATFSSADYLRGTNATAEILARNGWSFVGLYNGDSDAELWRRPGKSTGVSALRHANEGNVHIWTTSTELEGGRTYSPLQLLAALEFGGDEQAASKSVFCQVNPTYTKPTDFISSLGNFGLLPEKEVVEEEPKEEEVKREIIDTTKYPRLPESCKKFPERSFLKEFVEKCKEDSGIEQEELYFGAALTTLSHIVGKKVRIGMSYPNMYCICCADSGCGKNAPLIHARNVANTFIARSTTNGFQSEQVMGDMFKQQSQLLWIQDEFGQWLDRAYQKGKAGSLQYDVLRMCTDLWSKAGRKVTTGASRKNKELSRDQANGNQGENESSYTAWLSMLTFTTPTSLQEFLNEHAEECGTIARFYFPIGSLDPVKRFQKVGALETTELEASICKEWELAGKPIAQPIDDFSAFENHEEDIPENNFAYVPDNGFDINIDDDVMARWEKDFYTRNKRTVKARTGESDEGRIKQFLARAEEYINKFAMLFACDKYGANFGELRIDMDCYKRACDYWDYCIECTKHLYSYFLNVKSYAENEMSKGLNKLYKKVSKKNESTVRFAMKDFTLMFTDKIQRDKIIQFLVEAEIVSVVEVEYKRGNCNSMKKMFDINVESLRKRI